MSPSSRRAWIEIARRRRRCQILCVALLAEGVDRNDPTNLAAFADREMSPSSRRAWIEMYDTGNVDLVCIVALLAEGVDRNVLLLEKAAEGLGRPPRGGRG